MTIATCHITHSTLALSNIPMALPKTLKKSEKIVGKINPSQGKHHFRWPTSRIGVGRLVWQWTNRGTTNWVKLIEESERTGIKWYINVSNCTSPFLYKEGLGRLITPSISKKKRLFLISLLSLSLRSCHHLRGSVWDVAFNSCSSRDRVFIHINSWAIPKQLDPKLPP